VLAYILWGVNFESAQSYEGIFGGKNVTNYIFMRSNFSQNPIVPILEKSAILGFHALRQCHHKFNCAIARAGSGIHYLMFWQCAIADAKVPMSKFDVWTLCQSRILRAIVLQMY
jgi:hypothetical protein